MNRHLVVSHLEETYGKENVCHIGTYSQEGVKSGLKDVGRALEIPFATMNAISKELDAIVDVPPQPKFKHYDELKESIVPREQMEWKKFHELEMQNQELFRLARNFEGLKRNFGIHASAYLAMPIPVTDVFPTRVDPKTGVTVTLYPGTTIEELQGVKFDLLGLKSLDVIMSTLHNINEELTIDDLYQQVDLEDGNIYAMLCRHDSDCVFQLESDMFKGLLDKIQPHSLGDISAITSLGRPGPLTAGMPDDYAASKNNGEEPPVYLRGIENITAPTYGVFCYQEQLMQISKQVSGFDTSQSDSLMRKIVAKKQASKMEMLRRCLIYGKKNVDGPEGWETDENAPWYDPKAKSGAEIPGALANGYTAEEMEHFWISIQGFASYAFNASHAMTYSYISALMAWLKVYYPTEFFTAILSIENDEQKREKYIKVAEEFAEIRTLPPDINTSNEAFTCDADSKIIRFGLASIKGVGAASVPTLIENRPYCDLEDMIHRLPKKAFNKTCAMNLIRSGALDRFNTNRLESLKRLYTLRKDKFEDFDTDRYCESDTMMMEKDTLGISLTYKPWWDSIKKSSKVIGVPAYIMKTSEITDRRGGLMAFLELNMNDCNVEAVAFARTYSRYQSVFQNQYQQIIVTGKKDDKEKLIIDKVEFIA